MISSLDKQAYIDELWNTELKGGIELSEYSTFLAKDAGIALVSGAFIAAIIVSCSAIESHLRFDGAQGRSLYELMTRVGFSQSLADEINKVRKFRNEWVHVNEPELDEKLLKNPEMIEKQCEEMAMLAYQCLVRALCFNQYV